MCILLNFSHTFLSSYFFICIIRFHICYCGHSDVVNNFNNNFRVRKIFKLLHKRPNINPSFHKSYSSLHCKVFSKTSLLPSGHSILWRHWFLMDLHRDIDLLRIDIEVTSLYDIFFPTS